MNISQPLWLQLVRFWRSFWHERSTWSSKIGDAGDAVLTYFTNSKIAVPAELSVIVTSYYLSLRATSKNKLCNCELREWRLKVRIKTNLNEGSGKKEIILITLYLHMWKYLALGHKHIRLRLRRLCFLFRKASGNVLQRLLFFRRTDAMVLLIR